MRVFEEVELSGERLVLAPGLAQQAHLAAAQFLVGMVESHGTAGGLERTVGVAALANPGFLVEIEVTAVKEAK